MNIPLGWVYFAGIVAYLLAGYITARICDKIFGEDNVWPFLGNIILWPVPAVCGLVYAMCYPIVWVDNMREDLKITRHEIMSWQKSSEMWERRYWKELDEKNKLAQQVHRVKEVFKDS